MAISLRARIRRRMAGIDRRLDDLQAQVEALRVPRERFELEGLIERGEAAGRLSPDTAGELRRWLADVDVEPEPDS